MGDFFIIVIDDCVWLAFRILLFVLRIELDILLEFSIFISSFVYKTVIATPHPISSIGKEYYI